MALSKEQIQAEVEAKGYKLVDASSYKNMESDITVECSKGHRFVTNIKAVRHPSFQCPECAKASFQVERPKAVPLKQPGVFRVVAFDQATYKMGMSIWDNGKLVYYDLFQFNDQVTEVRLVKIERLLSEVVVPIWKPDVVVFEDIQEQGGVKGMKTFKILAMLLGVCITTIEKLGVKHVEYAPVVWRKEFGAVSGGRQAEKSWAVNKVHELTGQWVNEDTSEAILIGYSACRKIQRPSLW